MPKPHDVGGFDLGSIDQAPHDPSIFERRVDAMVRCLIREKRLFTTDALRRSVEDLPAAAYVDLSYYERWLHGLTTLLLESGSLTETQLTHRRAAVAQRMAAAHDDSIEPNRDTAKAPTPHADHAAVEHDHRPPNEHEILGETVRELGIEAGLFSGADIHRLIEQVEATIPTHGPRLVVKAWTEPSFMDAVIGDARAAAEQIGIDLTDTTAHRPSPTQATPIISSFVRCAPAIPEPYSACRQPGTKAGNTGPARLKIRAGCWPSLALFFPTPRVSRPSIRLPICVTSSFRDVRPEPTGWLPAISKHWLAVIA